MSYEKQRWQSGDTITAGKLNHIENGIASGKNILLSETITVDGDNEIHTLNATYNEMVSTITNGGLLLVEKEEDVNGIINYSIEMADSPYHVYDGDVAGMPVGYYYEAFSGSDAFYSATPDDVMTYTKGTR